MSNKQRNDMQKSVHIASMTYRLHIGIHCHTVVFLHMGMLCTSCLNIMGDYLPYCCNNPYTQKKHYGDYWIIFCAENNKIHAIP